MNRIVVIGSSNIDMIIHCDRLPVQGQIVAGRQFAMKSGGKGANQAIAVARMGGSVALVTKIGNDLFGKQSLELYESEGISLEYVFSDPDLPSSIGLIMSDSLGEKYISIAQGAIRNLTVEDIERARPVIEGADFLLMELEIPIETAEYVTRIAAAHDVTVILNPSPVQAISPSCCTACGSSFPTRPRRACSRGSRSTTGRRRARRPTASARRGSRRWSSRSARRERSCATHAATTRSRP